jgi:hypothetical protein
MKRVVQITILLFGLSAMSFTQSLGDLSKQDDPSKQEGTLEGSVINSQNGRVVPRATVIVRNLKKVAEARSVRADGQGHFVVKNLQEGTYRLTAEHPSYFSGTRHQVFQYRVDLASGEQHSGIVLNLQPAAVITGQINDENSDPLQNVQVQLYERIYRGGRMVLDPAGGARTDDRGIYRMFEVRPGSYYVVAIVQPGAAPNKDEGESADPAAGGPLPESDIAYLPAFYPDVTELQQAHTVQIRGGDEANVNFAFVAKPAIAIRGKVVNGVTGEPAPNAAITALWSEYLETMANTAKSAPKDGSFEIRGIAPGVYTLHAAFSINGTAFTAKRRVETTNGGLENVVLEALPDTLVDGSVQVEVNDKQPRGPQRLQIVFQSNTSPLHSETTAGLPPGASTTTHDLGFQARLRPGEQYTISARGLPQNYYLKAVMVDGEEVDPDKVIVGDQQADIKLVLSPSGGYIQGLVVDDSGNAKASAAIVLVPEESRRGITDLFRKSSSDKDGWFRIRGVPPGTYQLFAFEDVDLNELIGQPELLKRFEDRSVQLTVEEQTDYGAALKIIRAAEELRSSVP